MMKIALLVLLAACGRNLVEPQLRAGDLPPHVFAEFDQCIGSKDSLDAGKKIKTLISEMAADNLAQMRKSSSATASLFAQWKLMSDRSLVAQNPPHRLFGFLEGRFGLDVPSAWERAFMELLANESNEHQKLLKTFLPHDQQDLLKNPVRPKRLLGSTFYSLQDLAVSETKDELTVARGIDKVTIDKRILYKVLPNSFPFHFVALHDDGSRLIVILFDSFGSKFPLFCFDKRSKKQNWIATAWAIGTENLGQCTGTWSHLPIVRSNEHYVAIFGFGTGACYFDVFDKKSGKAIARFSTNYWFAK